MARTFNFFASLLYGTLLFANVAHSAGINDTGITTFFDDWHGVPDEPSTHPRQDASYGRDAAARAGTLSKVGGGSAGFDFTKVANDGSVLPTSAALGTGLKDWACTRDNVTRLMWEVKTTSGLRSQSHTYTWYNSNSATNGGSTGTASGGTCQTSGRCDTEKFVEDVNAARLCGTNDWRMPSIKELISIVNFGRVLPAIDPTYFPNIQNSAEIWSSSITANATGGAFTIGIVTDGHIGSSWKDALNAVLLVHDAP